MSVQLLDRTRKINKLLHNNSSGKVVFTDICQVLTQTLKSNAMVISRKGKVLGISFAEGIEPITDLIEDEVGLYIDPELNERFLGVLSTKENVNLETLGFLPQKPNQYQGIINPIEIAGERLGTVFMYRNSIPYDVDDIIVSEFGTTVVGLEMMRAVHEENAEELRQIQIVKSAINTLSTTEYEAVVHILEELGAREGVLVASKVADRVGITRSVIVNGLRKLESAGIIESHSSGMRGTYIKVVNDFIFDEFPQFRPQK
ncbi:MAG: GTP-sensing pleiotropic transcriptional regulator CodY [Lachnospiraceae bacterium]